MKQAVRRMAVLAVSFVLAVTAAGAAAEPVITLTATGEVIHAGELTIITAEVTNGSSDLIAWEVDGKGLVDYYTLNNQCMIVGKETDAVQKITVTARRHQDAASIIITLEPSLEVTLDKERMSLAVGEAGQLTVKLPAQDGTAYWSSSDNSVAKVDSGGVVTGVGEGTAVISVLTGGGKTDSCYVTVGAVQPLVSLKLDKSVALMVGGERKLTAVTDPPGRPVHYTSGDSSVAAVDSEGRVTGVSAGSTVITAEAEGQTAECTVKVLDVLSLSMKRITVGLESSAELTASVVGVPATAADVVWNISDTAVAELSGSSGPQITIQGKSEGEADITAVLKVDGMTASYTTTCRVKVVQPVKIDVTVQGKYSLGNPGVEGERSIAGQLSGVLGEDEPLSYVEFESVEDKEGNKLEADAGKRYASGADLNSVLFVPAAGFTGDALFPFTAVGAEGGAAIGDLVFRVQGSGETATLYLNAGDGGSAMLRTETFETLWRAAFPEGKLSYIQFSTVDSGTIYSGARTLKAGEKCYVSPESYALGIYGLRFVSENNRKEAAAAFTAIGTDKTGRSVKKEGRLVLIPTAEEDGSITLAYNCDSTGVAFDANTFFSGSGSLRNAAYLIFSAPGTGALMVDTAAGSRLIRVGDCFAAYSDPAAGILGISSLSYVPEAGSAGTVNIPFSAYSAADALLIQGNVRVSVLPQDSSETEDADGTGGGDSTDVGSSGSTDMSSGQRPTIIAASFPDVTADAWYYPYVMELTGTGIVNGYPDGTYRPDGNVTNGEALKLIMLACGYGETEGDKDWVSGYVAQAKADGIIGGTFDPYIPATRGGFAEMAARAMGIPPALDGASPFVDTNDRWARALYGCNVDGERIISGLYDESGQLCFRPIAHITRAEAAKIVTLIFRGGPFVAVLPPE